jgi:hypothetical protein
MKYLKRLSCSRCLVWFKICMNLTYHNNNLQFNFIEWIATRLKRKRVSIISIWFIIRKKGHLKQPIRVIYFHLYKLCNPIKNTTLLEINSIKLEVKSCSCRLNYKPCIISSTSTKRRTIRIWLSCSFWTVLSKGHSVMLNINKR